MSNNLTLLPQRLHFHFPPQHPSPGVTGIQVISPESLAPHEECALFHSSRQRTC